jgi:hypothetical protein
MQQIQKVFRQKFSAKSPSTMSMLSMS